MKKNLFIIICIFFLQIISCGGNEEKLRKIIHGDGFRYWLISDSATKSKTLYYMDKNGKWLIFILYDNGSFEKYNGGDISLIENWKLIDLNTIDIGTSMYSVEEANENELVLSKISNKKTLKLVLAPDSLIPINYRTIQK